MRQANDLLEYRDIIVKGFDDGTFPSKHLKKSDDAAYNYVLKDVNIEEIKPMEEKINLSLFKEFLELSPVDYAKELINTKNTDGNKWIVEEIEYRTLDLENEIKRMSEKEKKEESADET